MLLLILFLYFFLGASPSYATYQRTIVYCTDNHDGTGDCFDTKNGSLFQCIATPGELINCRSSEGQRYDCIYFQTFLFSCSAAINKSNPARNNIEDFKETESNLGIKDNKENGKELDKDPILKQRLKIEHPLW